MLHTICEILKVVTRLLGYTLFSSVSNVWSDLKQCRQDLATLI